MKLKSCVAVRDFDGSAKALTGRVVLGLIRTI